MALVSVRTIWHCKGAIVSFCSKITREVLTLRAGKSSAIGLRNRLGFNKPIFKTSLPIVRINLSPKVAFASAPFPPPPVMII